MAARRSLALLLAVNRRRSRPNRGSPGIVVFGTSLSDAGNAFALAGDARTPPDFPLNPLLIPRAPYAQRRPPFQQRRDVGRAVSEVGRAGPQRPAGPGDG